MQSTEAAVSVGGFVETRLPNRLIASRPVYGRVSHIEGDAAIVNLPQSMGHGFSQKIPLAELRGHPNSNSIPIGQLEELGVPLRTAVPELFG